MDPCTPSNAGLAWSRSAALALVLAWLASCSSLPHWMPGSTRHAPARISAADYDRAMSEAKDVEMTYLAKSGQKLQCRVTPERLAFKSDQPVLVGLDVTRQATLSEADVYALEQLPELGPGIHGMLLFYLEKHREWHGENAVQQHDSLALSWVIDPTLLSLRPLAMGVDDSDGPGRGETYVVEDPAADVTVRWAIDLHAARFRELLLERLGALAAAR